MLVSKYYSAMGKSILLLFPLLIWGCEQTYDNVLDTSTENYQVSSIAGIKDSIDLKIPGDSLLSPRVNFVSGSELSGVSFNVIASDLTQLNSSPIIMTKVANNIYEGEFILESQNPNGLYTITFSVTGTNGNNKKVAESNFNFNNGQDNVPPVISNLMMPDTIQTGQTIIMTVEVADSNGLNDVESVYYEAYDPDGNRVSNSQGIYQFPMFDDGDTAGNGDVTADDGIFTVRLTFPVNAQIGTWRFQFQAKDRANALSNIINHYVLIQ